MRERRGCETQTPTVSHGGCGSGLHSVPSNPLLPAESGFMDPSSHTLSPKLGHQHLEGHHSLGHLGPLWLLGNGWYDLGSSTRIKLEASESRAVEGPLRRGLSLSKGLLPPAAPGPRRIYWLIWWLFTRHPSCVLAPRWVLGTLGGTPCPVPRGATVWRRRQVCSHLPHHSVASAVAEGHGALSSPSVSGRVPEAPGRPGEEGTG